MLSENNRGALLMIGAMASFTCNDSTVKVILGDLPLFQTLFLRGIGAVAALWLVSRWMEPMRFDISRRDWVLILVRGLCELGSAFFFLSALQRMPLPNATAILQALPLVDIRTRLEEAEHIDAARALWSAAGPNPSH